ncbi:hypothetical protein QBC45DRAFT_425681 [Copromyces sp. CBS 386.78]|nr:hypothetical protein QBC45DRAFT_425681 [Copromyces sp. CBS 386.78]
MSLEQYDRLIPEHFPPTLQTGIDNSQGSSTSNGQGQGSKPEDKKKAPTKGFVDIVEYHTSGLGGREVTIYPTSRFVAKQTSKKTKDYKVEDHAVILRRIWVERDGASIPSSFELEIHSEALCKEFRKIAAKAYENVDLKTFPIKIRSPFMELFFYREEIRELSLDDKDKDLQVAAKALDEFIRHPDSIMASILQDHDKYSAKGQVANDIIWTIYRPNSLLVFNMGSIQECWICRNVLETRIGREPFWEVTGLRLDFDGKSPGLTRQELYIPITGLHPMKIASLPLMPAESYPKWDSLKALLQARSQTLKSIFGADCCSFRCQSYTGAAWKQRRDEFVHREGCNPAMHDKSINERVMVDFKAFGNDRSLRQLEDLENSAGNPKKKSARATARGMMPMKRLKPKKDSVSDSDSDGEAERRLQKAQALSGTSKPNDGTESREDNEPDLQTFEGVAQAIWNTFFVSEEELELTFPALVPAFGLRGKKWWWVLSDNLQDVVWNTTAFDSLQLEKVTKNLVQGLVKGHKSQTVTFDDVIEGKGQGLIFLLHGKPGLGKTLTAESVADFLERPLYAISGGELGTQVREVEDRLEKIFDMAKRWNAVTLLDEADVLLCKRSSAEMDRNAIVAVFLRTLEYFQGVLFLTTNRKQDFDPAFKSRIHVTITYPDLSSEAKSQIWESLITKNKAVGVDDSWTPSVFTALGQLDMNGRTIKNILRTAVAYANSGGEPLGARHVLAILRTELRYGDQDSDEGNAELSDGVHPSLEELHKLLDVPFQF